MTDNMVNIVIKKAIKDKKVDLLEFTKANAHQEYHEFYLRISYTRKGRFRKAYLIDFSKIGDSKLMKRLVGFMWEYMNPTERNALSYHVAITQALSSVLNFVSKAAKNDYELFMAETAYDKTISCDTYIRQCLRMFHRYCMDKDFLSEPYSVDAWNIDLLNIAPERMNSARAHKYINFANIKNNHNKSLVKGYTKHLLLNTDNSIATIISNVSYLKKMLSTNDKTYTTWNVDDADKMLKSIENDNIKKKTIGSYILALESFTKYLLVNNIISYSPIKHLHDITTAVKYEYKETSPDKFVIHQIFGCLNKFKDASVALCFMLIYCTGMRVSEACGILKDCLEVANGNYFVRFYQVKMKKEVTNVIPEALYGLIKKHIKSLPENSLFLFPSKKPDKPRQSMTFSTKMISELAEFSITQADGSPYNFTSHSFRHLMAVRMRNEDMPFQFIQEQLHHESAEMTLAYVEFLDRQKIEKMKTFINNEGVVSPLVADIEISKDEEYAEYMCKFINAQMLPNGVCARPVKLGRCHHCNACLKCNDYRTSLEFLSVHEKQLKEIDNCIEFAIKNNWVIQLQDYRENKERLQNIINALKKNGVQNG